MNAQEKKLPGLRRDPIEKKVALLLKKHGIIKTPIPVKEIAEQEGIDVRFQPFNGESDISAVLKRGSTKTIIGVNSSHSSTRQRFSIAHELGHYFLHQDEGIFVDFGKSFGNKPTIRYRNSVSSMAVSKDEIEANRFAASLLMPFSLLKHSVEQILEKNPNVVPDNAVRALATEYHVSPAAMEFRLLNVGMLVKMDD